MKIPPTSYQAGVCGQDYPHILPHPGSKNQAFSTKISYSSHCQNSRLAKLSRAIEQKNLHDSLEILEESGFRSEIALFMLAFIQQSLEVGL